MCFLELRIYLDVKKFLKAPKKSLFFAFIELLVCFCICLCLDCLMFDGRVISVSVLSPVDQSLTKLLANVTLTFLS